MAGSTIRRGLLAGAVGTIVLDLATYLDMALSGRPASDAPAEMVQRTAGRLGVPTTRDPHRRAAYGALGGIVAGLSVGVLASGTRRLGVRLPAPVGATATGAAAMLATDLPMVVTGVSDPRSWTGRDWARDVVPHLAYGAAVRWVLDRTEPPPAETHGSAGGSGVVSGGLLVRSLALGAAAGGRSTLGLAVPALMGRSRALALVATTLLAAELTADKLPAAPSRTGAAPTLLRSAAGGGGAWVLAGREGAPRALPAVAGIAGAAAGTFAGAVWRELAARRGLTWQAALLEDGVALGLARLATGSA